MVIWLVLINMAHRPLGAQLQQKSVPACSSRRAGGSDTEPMSKHDSAEGQTSVRLLALHPYDYPVTCVDLALDYAPDELLADFEAWSAARDCTTWTLRRQVEA